MRGQFNGALVLFEKKDYTGAQQEFQRLLYIVRATELEDDVQFYLAESHYRDRQFIVALDAYQAVIRNTPASPYAKPAYFQIGMCYTNMSPVYSLDQEQTKLAVQQFQAFIDNYPAPDTLLIEARILAITESVLADSSRPAQARQDSVKGLEPLFREARSQYTLLDTLRLAEENIKVCRKKLARKMYESALQYVQLETYRAATLYFDNVISGYSDSDYFEPALRGKIDVLMIRSRWADAREAIELYEERFPDRKSAVAFARQRVDAALGASALKSEVK